MRGFCKIGGYDLPKLTVTDTKIKMRIISQITIMEAGKKIPVYRYLFYPMKWKIKYTVWRITLVSTETKVLL